MYAVASHSWKIFSLDVLEVRFKSVARKYASITEAGFYCSLLLLSTGWDVACRMSDTQGDGAEQEDFCPVFL